MHSNIDPQHHRQVASWRFAVDQFRPSEAPLLQRASHRSPAASHAMLGAGAQQPRKTLLRAMGQSASNLLHRASEHVR